MPLESDHESDLIEKRKSLPIISNPPTVTLPKARARALRISVATMH